MGDYESIFVEKEHQGAYVFDPESFRLPSQSTPKKKKQSKKQSKATRRSATTATTATAAEPSSRFVPLLAGRESHKCRDLRRTLFSCSWSAIDQDVRRILREANQSTLDQVASFVQSHTEPVDESQPSHAAPTSPTLPAAFILSGPNIASQNLLFEQLDESLNSHPESRSVKLRSADAPNLKTALKTIIRHVTNSQSHEDALGDEGDLEPSVAQNGRRYLAYDLEALHAHVQAFSVRSVTIAFQDSEAFDTGLLADLVLLFRSWIGRIPIVLVFGVATSIDLFQARLSRTTCQSLSGEQFDVAQSSHVLDRVFRSAVASTSVPLRLGPNLLGSMLDRQQDHVAGIHGFASSVKYAYMCHFYTNPISILLANPEELALGDLQSEHIEVIRQLPSFRHHVEELVEAGRLSLAKALLTDDETLASYAVEHVQKAKEWTTRALKSLSLMTTFSLRSHEFTNDYLSALSDGFEFEGDAQFSDQIKRMSVQDVDVLLEKALTVLEDGDDELSLPPWADEVPGLVSKLRSLAKRVQSCQDDATAARAKLKSKYSAQSRVLRTTIIAQKVQLSQDVSSLAQWDKDYTLCIEELAEVLANAVSCPPVSQMFLSEAWLFDSRTPYRSIFIPCPGPVVERALARPHDYLGCACCVSREGDLVTRKAPATSVLYNLYQDAGSIVNVADLWMAFYGLVGQGGDGNADGEGGDDGVGLDEREALALFYRGFAELKLMGFVKATKKKADHIAKLKHLS